MNNLGVSAISILRSAFAWALISYVLGLFTYAAEGPRVITLEGEIVEGKVESISSRIDPSTRSILARIIVDNSNFEIIPGQLMTVKVIYDETNQIGVPESAVTIQGNTAFVYIVNVDTAEKKNIKMGKRNFGKVSIVSGINEGDMVISEGVSKVRNNAKVKIINP